MLGVRFSHVPALGAWALCDCPLPTPAGALAARRRQTAARLAGAFRCNRGRQFVVRYATRALTARAGQPASMPMVQSMAPSNFKARAKFSDSHATLDPDRACSAAQDGTLSLSKAAIRLTQMMKAGGTFLYVPCNPANHNHRRPQCGITMTAPQHWIELRRTLVFGAGVLP